MDSNLKIFLGEFEKHKGEFVITDNDDIQRLVGIARDDMDYYYVFWNGRKIMWQTCVARYVPLKGYIEDKHYNNFVRVAKLNHYDLIGKDDDEVVIKYREDLKKETLENGNKGTNELLTEICWELN